MVNSRPLREDRGLAALPSSTSVFHAPQASQRPDQRVDAAPQLWQTKFCVRATIEKIVFGLRIKRRDRRYGNAG
jgi:hypothetical protein